MMSEWIVCVRCRSHVSVCVSEWSVSGSSIVSWWLVVVGPVRTVGVWCGRWCGLSVCVCV